MRTSSEAPRWHSNDFVLRLHESCVAGDSEFIVDDALGRAVAAFDLGDEGTASESRTLLRSQQVPTSQVLSFAARNRSAWALNIAAHRLTSGLHDWSSLRGVLLRFSKSASGFEPTLDRLPFSGLWDIFVALRERALDEQTEQALITFFATRASTNEELNQDKLVQLMESLVHHGLIRQASELIPHLKGSSWRHTAVAAALVHPRFGGSADAFLGSLNRNFYQAGLERLTIDVPYETAEPELSIQHLTTERVRPIEGGPTVTVIMRAETVGQRQLASAKSVLTQSYRNLELLILDATDSTDQSSLLDELSQADSRVKILRTTEAFRYAQINEALTKASGEFTTFQDEDGWSHPRRIETQVRDLLRHSGTVANLVQASFIAEDLAIVDRRGSRLFVPESSLMFRTLPVLEQIGYFEVLQTGAATEYRLRIEAVTGTAITAVGPEVPMQLLVDGGSEDEQTLTLGQWKDPRWLAYRASFSKFHDEIRSGSRSAYVPREAEQQGSECVTYAPSQWRTDSLVEHHVDVLVIADARWSEERSDFINALADELLTAAAAGLTVALYHGDSLAGPKSDQPIAGSLRDLIAAGKLVRAFDDEPVTATLAVVRHAAAAQGHNAERLPITAEHVVVVEDRGAGDVRGETISTEDVEHTTVAWFGADPKLVMAQSIPPRPKKVSVVIEEDIIRVTMRAADPEQISAIRVGAGREFVDLDFVELSLSGQEHAESHSKDLLVGSGSIASLPAGDLFIGVVRKDEQGQDSIQSCWIGAKSVVTYRSSRLLIPNAQRGLNLLPVESSQESLGTEEFLSRYLAARVSHARIFRDHLELTVEQGPETELTAVYALREVEGRIRRRDFPLDKTFNGCVQGVHPLADIMDTRWMIFGSFQTPYGPVEYPVDFSQEIPSTDSEDYRIRKLQDHGLGVIHVVPQNKKEPKQAAPVLSVVMPVFNVGPFLDASISSVLTQDFQDFELIIVDDASTDNGRKVIEMYAGLDPRIRFIALEHNTLGGAGVPSNLGIRAARGKYIGFVDSDDFITKDGFAAMIRMAEKKNAELVIGDFRTFGQDDRVVADSYDGVRRRDLPVGEVISASTHPSLFRLSPVPWRKLYRHDFVKAHQVLYPEGDYFYEDNPLHWQVLSRAERIVVCDEVVSYHRMEREGQTMGANAYRLGAIASHANTILNVLAGSTVEHRELLFEEFVDYVSRQRWVVRRQTQAVAAKIIKHRLTEIYEKALEIEPATAVPKATATHFAGYRNAYPELDLTIVMPVYNSADMLKESLDSVLKLSGVAYDVILIDDGSTDDSLQVMRKYEKEYPQVHVFEQKNRGAGRARNAVIPLCTGRYTYFLDADDVINATALREAVQKANREQADLLFVPYRIEFIDQKKIREMSNDDAEVWRRLPEVTDHSELQSLLAGLVNYPWNRIIRTSVLHDQNIFFGPTIVHNDVLFHWHSILAAETIGFLESPVCTHRKFATRAQITNIQDERRMAVLEALRGTHQRIVDLPNYDALKDQWENFTLHLLEWAADRIPMELRESYHQQGRRIVDSLAG